MVMASISWVFSSCAEVSVHLIGLENQKKGKTTTKKNTTELYEIDTRKWGFSVRAENVHEISSQLP